MSFSSHKAQTTLGQYVGARNKTDRVRGGKTEAKSRSEGQVGKAESGPRVTLSTGKPLVRS